MDQLLRGPNLEVEMPEEVHADETIEILVAKRKHRHREVWRRDP